MEACYPIVEVYGNGREPVERGSVFHLRDAEDVSQSLCGQLVANGTMIPLSWWGHSDSRWCPSCRRIRYNRIRQQAGTKPR